MTSQSSPISFSFPFDFIENSLTLDIAIIVVVALFKLIDYLTIRSKRFEKFAEEDPTLLVKDGAYIEEGFKKARITRGEFHAHMRTNGIKDISEVEESYLEITGQISFIKKKATQEATQQ